LWFGWFGFNAGSAVAANGIAALAFTATMLAPAATLVVWMVLDIARTGKPTAVGTATAIVVGLVAITPAAGFVGPMSALILGGSERQKAIWLPRISEGKAIATLAFEESGVNPLQADPEGFRLRCLRRIQQGRTWVVVDNGSLVFKGEVISQTTNVAYLEGIWTRHDKRQNGDSVRYLCELSRKLLQEVNSVCLLVNEKNLRAKAFYRKCGFLFRASYKTIFLKMSERSN